MRRTVLLCLALVATTLCQAPLETLPGNDKGYLKIRNAEFLFTGGIHVKDDKYWCLHKAVYRKPHDQRVNTAPSGRSLQAKVGCDAGCTAMADFLCSNGHLVFTDNQRVCLKMAQTLGQKYKPFFTVEQFRQKMANAINRKYNQLATIRKQPRSAWRMRQRKFLKKCDKQIDDSMNNLVLGDKNLDAADVKYAAENDMNIQVVQYVMLNVEDLFIKDKVAAKDAWRNAYPGFKKKCAGKKFSEYSVRYFIEAIRLRYKPRTDIPTPNQEGLGIPTFGPGKTTPIKRVFPTYSEDKPKISGKKPTFEFSETPTTSKKLPPYSKSGKTKNTKPKVNPTSSAPHNSGSTSTSTSSTPKSEETKPEKITKIVSETPGELTEKEPTKAIPQSLKDGAEPTTTAPKKTKSGDDKDVMTRVEIIEIQRSWNIQKALINYDRLTTSMKKDINNCKLSLVGAMERCEGIHGKGNCQALTPTYVGPKCPAGQVREGCCTCVPACPKGFVADKLFCKKPTTYFTNPRSTKKHCMLANARKCEKVGTVWASKCRKNFKRIGSALCVSVCPKDTVDMGDKCLRKATRVGDIFAWSAGEE